MKKIISPLHFYQNTPLWKRKKDPLLTRLFYRPFSFILSSGVAYLGISANTVSYSSIFIALLSFIFFIIPDYICTLIAAILVNVWLLMDCIDGNLARCVQKQAYGEFADSLGSYALVALMGLGMGVSVYYAGGYYFQAGDITIVILGAIASISDTFSRLTYQKFKTVSYDLHKTGIIPEIEDKRRDPNQSTSFQVKVENELGIGGLLPAFVLIGTIFHFLDIVVIYCFCFYGASCLAVLLIYTKRAIKSAKAYPMNTK